jgi:hypothetical protein
MPSHVRCSQLLCELPNTISMLENWTRNIRVPKLQHFQNCKLGFVLILNSNQTPPLVGPLLISSVTQITNGISQFESCWLPMTICSGTYATEFPQNGSNKEHPVSKLFRMSQTAVYGSVITLEL